MDNSSRIFIADINSFIGGAIYRALKREGYSNIIPEPPNEPDLRDKETVNNFFAHKKPEYVFLAAGKSAGIMGNIKYPAELMLDNLLVECNVIDSAYRHGVKKLLYLASNCCYPRNCPQPMKESYLLTGPLEPTNEPYAVAKITGIKLCQSYRSQFAANDICGIPANSFGPHDDFGIDDSHVVGALMRKIHEAKKINLKEVILLGTGKPRREFMYIEELADACIFIMQKYEEIEPINIGPGGEVSIGQLAIMMKEIIGFEGTLIYDTSKPDGMPIKLLDTKKLTDLGWKPFVNFKDALTKTYSWYVNALSSNRDK